MSKLIAANWKENPRSEREAVTLFRATAAAARASRANVAVCPPFVYLEALAAARRRESARGARLRASRVALGAQDVFWEETGPYTSEVGGRMLRSLGVKYVIVGHSERRKWAHETDAVVNRKVKRALADGLTVILCVGEPWPVRKKGSAAARRFVEGQLKRDLAGIRAARARAPHAPRPARRVIVAYEPVWAIGSGRSDKPADAAEMAEVIKNFSKKHLRLRGAVPRVLYGGSVDGKNARDYVQLSAIGGALVGGASLKAGEFKKILKAA